MERILIIEDEVVIRRALAKLLKREGYDISEASSVSESEALFSLDAFGLIIADLRLPGGLGTEVIEKCAGTPVLIMTSLRQHQLCSGVHESWSCRLYCQTFQP